jgi:hypothetical protein
MTAGIGTFRGPLLPVTARITPSCHSEGHSFLSFRGAQRRGISSSFAPPPAVFPTADSSHPFGMTREKGHSEERSDPLSFRGAQRRGISSSFAPPPAVDSCAQASVLRPQPPPNHPNHPCRRHSSVSKSSKSSMPKASRRPQIIHFQFASLRETFWLRPSALVPYS